MIESEHPQRSPGWHKDRLGIPTASKFAEIITTKGAPTSGDRRRKYLDKLIGEYVTGRRAYYYASKQMREKAEREEDSILDYELRNNVEIRRGGFCWKDEQRMFGASPDGLIDPDGGFETKDADPHVQIMRRRTKWSGMGHFHQCQGGMYVCNRKWWVLRSYCEGMQPIDIIFKKDEIWMQKLEIELIKFCRDLAAGIRREKEAS